MRITDIAAALTVLLGHVIAQQHEAAGCPHVDCVPPAETRRIQQRLAAFAATLPPQPEAADPDPYPFLPVAGNLWADLHTYNFVDLDPTGGLRDYLCTDWTYDTHRGHDIHLHSFAEMDRGVPVFAARPGIVADVHDGEPDRNTVPSSLPSNYVILWHGGTHYTWYLHLRRNSIAVTLGERVAGGQQLGLVGSSGNSAWPHLHFESWHDNSHFEPSAGPCQARPSRWTAPIARPTNTFVSDFHIGPGDFHTQPPLPNDYRRQGTWGTGWQYIGLWFQYHNLPANSTARVRWLRPDNSVAIDSGTGPFGGSAPSRFDWVWFRWWVQCDQVGAWQVELTLNGVVRATMPFDVVLDPGTAPNRAPEPLATAGLEPTTASPGDVIWCRVQQGLLSDRDQDVVSYRYVWRRNGVVIRDATHAGKADCLRDDQLLPGATIQCTVTPTDGVRSGPASVASGTVATGDGLALTLRGAGHADGSGRPLGLGPGPRQISFAPTAGAVPVLAVSLSPCGAGSPWPQPPGCTLPAGVLMADLARSPLLTTIASTLTVPAGLPWCYCVQGAEIRGNGGITCMPFTHGYHLNAAW